MGATGFVGRAALARDLAGLEHAVTGVARTDAAAAALGARWPPRTEHLQPRPAVTAWVPPSRKSCARTHLGSPDSSCRPGTSVAEEDRRGSFGHSTGS